MFINYQKIGGLMLVAKRFSFFLDGLGLASLSLGGLFRKGLANPLGSLRGSGSCGSD